MVHASMTCMVASLLGAAAHVLSKAKQSYQDLVCA